MRFESRARERRLDLMRWGLVPRWAKTSNDGDEKINTPVEAVTKSSAFQSAFRSRRCLVPVNGFCVWQRSKHGPRQSHYIVPNGEPIFAFAGLWEDWQNPITRTWLHSFTIVVGPPNSLVAAPHDRMPVILDKVHWPVWLGEANASPDQLRRMIAEQYPTERMNLCREGDPK